MLLVGDECHLQNHWSVENSARYTLDATLIEDGNRMQKGNGPEINSVLRRLALSILKSDMTINDHVRSKRLIADWNLESMKAVLFVFQAV